MIKVRVLRRDIAAGKLEVERSEIVESRHGKIVQYSVKDEKVN